MVVAMVIAAFAGVVMAFMAVCIGLGCLALAKAEVDGAAVAAPRRTLGGRAAASRRAGGGRTMAPMRLVVMPVGMVIRMFVGV
ncbi:hypothetical protein D3C72_1536000 [compost metagenome]